MATIKEASQKTWTSNDSTEHINAGSLQRIADAVEAMATDHVQLLRNVDFYKRGYEERGAEVLRLHHAIAGHKAAYTKLKRKLK
jgi:hypothetical protein